MVHTTRAFISLLIVCLLLTACGPAANNQPTKSKPQTSSTDVCPGPTKAVPTCITPHALRVAYGIESLIQKGYTGKGQTIVDITSFDSPSLQNDMKVFDQTFNLPPVDLQVISPLNEPEADPNKDKETWAEGTVQEVQLFHAIAPEAKIVLLESPVAETEGTFGLPEFRKLLQYTIDHQLGNIVSLRWNVSEATLQDAPGQQELQQWNDLLQQGTTKDHITYIATSGSSGAANLAADGQKMADVPTSSFPADSPWVTSVGGTNLLLTKTDSILSETGWSDSGGGFSNIYPMPSYQQLLPAAVQQQFNNHRGIPDVAADEDNITGPALFVKGQWVLAGGNSSAPIWTALQAIANQVAKHPLGFINPGLYKLATSSTYQQDFHDITTGDNSYNQAGIKGYSAGPGWDPVTGLGTPNAEKLIPDLITALK
jgi:subtilase family serine protease